MQEGLRSYLAAASELTALFRRRVAALAKTVRAHSEATAEQVGAMTDDFLETGRQNREALANLVRFEIDRSLTRMGLATSDEVHAVSMRLAALEAQLGPTAAVKSPAKKVAHKSAHKSAQKSAQKSARKAAKKSARSTVKATAPRAAKKSTTKGAMPPKPASGSG